MSTRREFLRKSSIVLATSLIVGDEALEAFERLTHRKVWALGGLPPKLWGDGIHDDTAALQWIMDHERGVYNLKPGTYLVSETLIGRREDDLVIDGHGSAVMKFAGGFDGPFLYYPLKDGRIA